MNTRRRLIFPAAILFAAAYSAPGWAQPGKTPDSHAAKAPAGPCILKPQFVTGRRLVYELEGRTEILTTASPPPVGNIRQPDTGPKVIEVYSQAATIRLTALGVDDSGAAAFSLVFTKIKNTATVDGKIDSLELTADAPPPADGAAEDSPAQAVTKAMIGAAIRFDVHADGTVSGVTGLEHAAEIAAKSGPHAHKILGSFAPAVVERTIAGLFRVDSPEFPARVQGDTWQVTDRSTLGNFGDMVTTAAMRLEACTNGQARVVGDIKVAIEPRKPAPGEQPDTGSPQLSIDDQSGTVAVTFDIAAGVLLSRVRDMTVATSERVGSVLVPNQRARNRLECKLVGKVEKSEP